MINLDYIRYSMTDDEISTFIKDKDKLSFPEDHIFRQLASKTFGKDINDTDVLDYMRLMPLVAEELLERYDLLKDRVVNEWGLEIN